MKSSSSTASPFPSTFVPTAEGRNTGRVDAGNFSREGVAQAFASQATTTNIAPDRAALATMLWSAQLTGLYAQRHEPTLAEVRTTLQRMSNDPDLPPKLHDAATAELAALVNEGDMPVFENFVVRVRDEASALAANTGLQPYALFQPATTAPQAMTTQGGPSQPQMQAQALARWSGHLSTLASQPGDAALDHMAGSLIDMGSDMGLPDHVRKFAIDTLLDTPEDGRAQPFQAFAGWMHHEANASIQQQMQGVAPVGSGTPAARNFGATPGAGTGAGQPPFVRPAPVATGPIAAMHPGPLSTEDALLLPSRQRPPVNTRLSAPVNDMLQYILQNPDLKHSEYVDYATTNRMAKSPQAVRKLIETARREIASGMDIHARDQMLAHLTQHMSSGRGTPFYRFAVQQTRTAAGVESGAGALNPRLYSILESAAQPLLVDNRLPGTATWSDLEPHVKEADKRVFDAAIYKDDAGYATAGVVSPRAPDPATLQPQVQPQLQPQLQPVQQQPVQQLPMDTLQSFVAQTHFPDMGTGRFTDLQSDLPSAKRPRHDDGTTSGFGQGVPSAPMQLPQLQQPVQLPIAASAFAPPAVASGDVVNVDPIIGVDLTAPVLQTGLPITRVAANVAQNTNPS